MITLRNANLEDFTNKIKEVLNSHGGAVVKFRLNFEAEVVIKRYTNYKRYEDEEITSISERSYYYYAIFTKDNKDMIELAIEQAIDDGSKQVEEQIRKEIKEVKLKSIDAIIKPADIKIIETDRGLIEIDFISDKVMFIPIKSLLFKTKIDEEFEAELEGIEIKYPKIYRMTKEAIPIFSFSVNDIKKIEDPITGDVSYVLTISNNKVLSEIRGDANEIFEQLRRKGYVLRNIIVPRLYAKDVLNEILFELSEKKIEPIAQGFFYIGDMVIANKVDLIKNGEAIDVIRELIERFYKYNQDYYSKFITVLAWILLSPFNFIKKQLGYEPIPFLLIYGWTRTGKTSMLRLCEYIWGVYRETSVRTIPQLSKELTQSTFPLILNEKNIDNLNEEVIDHIKRSYDQLIFRETYFKKYYAFSNIAITTNYYPSRVFKDPALNRRFYIIEMNRDVVSNILMKKDEYTKFLRENKEKLRGLSEIVFEYVANKLEEFLEMNWLEFGIKMLKDLGIIDKAPRFVEEIEEEIDIKELIIQRIRDYVLEKASRYGYKGLSFVEAIETLKLPFILYKDEKIIITKEALAEIKMNDLNISTLSQLAEILNGEYKKVKIGNKSKWVAIIPISEFEILSEEIGFEEIEEHTNIEQKERPQVEITIDYKEEAKRLLKSYKKISQEDFFKILKDKGADESEIERILLELIDEGYVDLDENQNIILKEGGN